MSASTSKHATILDVAAAAGVSKSTVSNVIRGEVAVAPDTRARVQEAIEQLGYRPNVLARQLVQQRTTTLGVVVGDLGNPFYAEMAKHIEGAASAHGYRAMFCNTQGDEETELSGLESLMEYRAAGVLFLSQPADRERARSIVSRRAPAVFVSCSADWGDVVSADDDAGAEMATEHLVELGHRRIAYFADPTVEDAADHDRQRGYRRVMERSGLPPAVFHWQRRPGDLLRQRRDEQVAQLVRDRFTAVFSSNDYGAIELLECADRLGVRVPDDLAVVGFDDVVMSGLARIGLTTVRQPQMELAGIAVEMLAGRINGEIEGPPQRRTLEVELVIRGSSARAGA
ncbi:MAG TPA: LacI family DNA-binding transcriptional regulator [Candidatus Dormibacteraeota bacterium]|nr:LacI family DNA-binding transcriptional regulator [Candidatus Dormibacteraeota bacterium]